MLFMFRKVVCLSRPVKRRQGGPRIWRMSRRSPRNERRDARIQSIFQQFGISEIAMSERLAICALALALACPAAPAAAASTPWQELGGGRARLVAVLDPKTSAVSGVVEIELDEGWKTYWREPGGSGIPPLFDFSGSQGFSADEIGFPVPQHIEMPDADFIGYRDRAAFTFEGMAQGSVGAIRLELMAGVCKDICIPATASLEIPLRDLFVSDIAAEDAVAAARADLPEAPRDDFRVTGARPVEAGFEIAVAVPDADAPAELFVEGLGAAAAMSVQALDRTGQSRRFVVEAPAHNTAPELTLTLSQGGRGVEQRVTPSR